jgi:hypothetical protein
MALKAPVPDKMRGDAIGVRLFTRRGLDWTDRYPSIAAAVAALSCRSCLIDGEVVIGDEDGVPVFTRAIDVAVTAIERPHQAGTRLLVNVDPLILSPA